MDKQFPMLLDRIQSTFIDLLIILLLTFATGYIIDQFNDVPGWIRMSVFIALWAVYEPVATSLGGTVGNHVKGLRVCSHNNYSGRINILQAYMRYTVKVTLGWLSFITINMNAEKRAIHDYLSGSVMIKKVRELPVEDVFPDLK